MNLPILIYEPIKENFVLLWKSNTIIAKYTITYNKEIFIYFVESGLIIIMNDKCELYNMIYHRPYLYN